MQVIGVARFVYGEYNRMKQLKRIANCYNFANLLVI